MQLGQVFVIDSMRTMRDLMAIPGMNLHFVNDEELISILKRIPGREIGSIPDEILIDCVLGRAAIAQLSNGDLVLCVFTHNFGACGTVWGPRSMKHLRTELRSFMWLYELAIFIATGACATIFVPVLC